MRRGRPRPRFPSVRLAGLALVGAGLAAVVVPLAFAACGGDPIYVYQGQRFDPARGCLERPTSLDVVEGPTEPKECPAVCLVQTSPDGTRTAYVAFTCAPYPPDFDATGKDPMCLPALAAAGQKNGCVPEAGAPETGTPETGAPEAGLDATAADADANTASDADAGDAATDAPGGD